VPYRSNFQRDRDATRFETKTDPIKKGTRYP